MKKNAMRGYIILAILLAVFCVVAFAVPFARTTVFWLGFGFGIFALLFQLYIFKTAEANSDARSRFYGFPIVRVGVYYLVSQLVISIIEMALAKVLPTWVPLIINILLAALAVIGCSGKEKESALRFSFSSLTTEEEIGCTLQEIREAVPVLRRFTRR